MVTRRRSTRASEFGNWETCFAAFHPADTGGSPAAGVEERQALREERSAGGGELSHADGARAIFIVVLLWRKHVALSAARRLHKGCSAHHDVDEPDVRA